MMNNKPDSLVISLADYIIKYNASERKVALYTQEIGFPMSNTSIKNLIDSRLPELDSAKYQMILDIRAKNKKRGLVDPKIQERMYRHAKLVKIGFTMKEVAILNDSSVNIVNADINYLLPRLDRCYADELKNILGKHRQNGTCHKKYIKESDYNNFILYNLQEKELEEIVLMCLTFRISKLNLARIYNTTLEDIDYTFAKLEKYSKALRFLDRETKYETKELSDLVYKKALLFLQQKYKLLEEIKENNFEKAQEYKDLLHIIDDNIVEKTISKDFEELSLEEKDSIANFIYKYAFSLKECKERLGRSKKEIIMACTSLKERDNIYNERIEFQYYYHILNAKKKKRRKEKINMSKKFYELPNSVIEEILLIALTYRVSMKTLGELFDTDENSLDIAINRQFTLKGAIISLEKETKYENDESANIAKKQFLEYWKLRQKLVKALNNATTLEEKNKYKRLLKQHRSQIDDTDIKSLVGVSPDKMTLEQKDIIARNRLKYGLSLKASEKVLHHKYYLIDEWCKDLALRDSAYAAKLEILDDYINEYKNEHYVKSFMNNSFEKNSFLNLSFPKFNNNFKLARDVSKNETLELIMATLTFRTPFIVLEKALNIPASAIKEKFKEFPEYSFALDKLEEETRDDAEEKLSESYNSFLNYWANRNSLLISLEEAKKLEDEKLINNIENQLHVLRSKVDDSLFDVIANKRGEQYTEREANYIALFPLKYYVSKSMTSRLLFLNPQTIHKNQMNYVLKYPSYLEKFERLTSTFSKPSFNDEASENKSLS